LRGLLIRNGAKDGAKMSKSKGNVVDPDSIIAKYGADTADSLSYLQTTKKSLSGMIVQ